MRGRRQTSRRRSGSAKEAAELPFDRGFQHTQCTRYAESDSDGANAIAASARSFTCCGPGRAFPYASKMWAAAPEQIAGPTQAPAGESATDLHGRVNQGTQVAGITHGVAVAVIVEISQHVAALVMPLQNAIRPPTQILATVGTGIQ